MSEWTTERVKQLRELWDDGLSASLIAARIGAVSRNAVLGKAFRLGLCGRKVTVRAPRPVRLRAAEPRKVRRVINQGNRIDIINVIEGQMPQELPTENIPIEQRKSLLDLTNHTCRWPYGHPDSEFFFCGAPEANFAAGRPYCRFHAVISRRKSRDSNSKNRITTQRARAA